MRLPNYREMQLMLSSVLFSLFYIKLWQKSCSGQHKRLVIEDLPQTEDLHTFGEMGQPYRGSPYSIDYGLPYGRSPYFWENCQQNGSPHFHKFLGKWRPGGCTVIRSCTWSNGYRVYGYSQGEGQGQGMDIFSILNTFACPPPGLRAWSNVC